MGCILPFDKFMNKYISFETVEEIDYIVLTMKEYNKQSYYKASKYFVYELIQDIDGINRENGIKTNFFEIYFPNFYT